MRKTYTHSIVIIAVLSLLLLTACDPSYKTEVPNLTEETYISLSLEEKFEVYKKASGYIDTPDYVSEGIVKEGERSIPFILQFIDESSNNFKKTDAAYLLLDIHRKYYTIRGTTAETFLQQKIREEETTTGEDKYLIESYKDVLQKIQTETTRQGTAKSTVLTTGYGNIPTFTTSDEDVITYVTVVKEKIMQETKMSAEQLDKKFAIIGYTKGNIETKGYSESAFGLPANNSTFTINYVTTIDWIEFHDSISFTFLDEQGNILPSEKIKQEITVPFHFGINTIKTKIELDTITTKTTPPFNITIQPIESPFYKNENIQINNYEKEIVVRVSGIIDEENNQCITGTINVVTGKVQTENVACLVQ